METRVGIACAANGATAEVCTIVGPAGQEATALGSLIDLEGGYVIAYATNAREHPARIPWIEEGDLTTWEGKRIGSYRVVARWKAVAHNTDWGIGIYRMDAVRATIDGDPREWYGRYGSDWSQLVRLRPVKG